MTMAPTRPAPTRRSTQIAAGVAVIALALLLIGVYRAGEDHARQGWVLEGRFTVGTDVASARVGDWGYGFRPSAVIWYDATGSHEGDKAPCLRQPGQYAHLQFGAVDAPLPDGGSYRAVTWVRCLP